MPTGFVDVEHGNIKEVSERNDYDNLLCILCASSRYDIGEIKVMGIR